MSVCTRRHPGAHTCVDTTMQKAPTTTKVHSPPPSPAAACGTQTAWGPPHSPPPPQPHPTSACAPHPCPHQLPPPPSPPGWLAAAAVPPRLAAPRSFWGGPGASCWMRRGRAASRRQEAVPAALAALAAAAALAARLHRLGRSRVAGMHMAGIETGGARRPSVCVHDAFGEMCAMW